MTNANQRALAVLLLVAALPGCQQSSPDSTPGTGAESATPVVSAPPPALSPITPLPPAEEKRLVELAKSRRAADGATVWEVLQNAEQKRPGIFKIAIVDVDYAKDSTPAAISVCYWIGNKRLDNDQYCKSVGWEIGADRNSLKPYSLAATQAVEAGRDAFVREVDQEYGKACAPAPKTGARAC